MKPNMRKHWSLTSALIGVFLTGSLTVGSASAAAQQVTLTVDKPAGYRDGETIVLTAKVDRGANIRKPFLWSVTESGSYGLDFKALLKRGEERFPAPSKPGDYTLELYDLSKHGPRMSAENFLTRVSFKVLPSSDANNAAAAAGSRTNRVESDARSEAVPAATSPFIRMVNPHVLVLGEKFEVTLQLPAAQPGRGVPDATLVWAIATGPGNGWTKEHIAMAGLPNNQALSKQPGLTQTTVSVLAPHYRPGLYELQLKFGSDVVGTLPVKVITGQARLSKVNKVYRPGEPIEFSVTLPENRYYHGGDDGPTAYIFPDNLPTNIPEDEARNRWSGTCRGLSCYTYMGTRGRVEGTQSPHEGGSYFRSGTYEFLHNPRAGEERIANPLFAPDQPGKYTLRFYDRGYPWRWGNFFDIPIATAEFEVKAAGPDLRFVEKCDAENKDAKELKELVQDAPSFLAARFAVVAGVQEAAQKTSTVKYFDVDGREKTTTLTLKRVAPGVYCSNAIVPVAPQEPRRSGRSG